MITGSRPQWEERCRLRGYTPEQVRPCIVREDGDTITVDETHTAYPRQRTIEYGPGTELKKLLGRWLGIVASPTCQCNAHARQMDAWGPAECAARLDEIVGWLEAEAKKKRLPFIREVARQMVRLAIRRARNAAGR